MKYKSFWINAEGNVEVIDQTLLPHTYSTIELKSSEDVRKAIKDMTIRGAGTIGSIAALGVYLAARECGGDSHCIEEKARGIRDARPTAINLMWAVDRMVGALLEAPADPVQHLLDEAIRISDEDVERTKKIGELGYDIIRKIMMKKDLSRINVLTHCNAGWLGIVNSGTALAPVYEAKSRGTDIHVWVDETRPRNQGANLTSWELQRDGVDHTIIADNTGGYLMAKGMVDLVIVGADRVSRNGDAANKIGTYLKALAAHDNDIPFYVALPASTFDFDVRDGMKDIPIETRSEDEVRYISGVAENGAPSTSPST
jgi:methylthioribose-1-phosphate isomerase